MTGVLLVTGCSTGIGRATTVRAAAAGWRVVATMREPAVDGDLLEAGVDVVRLDVTDEGSVARCIHDVRDRYGRLDALVNNAGISNFDPTMEMSDLDNLRRALEVNFVGAGLQ
jgi:NAD(P)-dependent dehydrogenase (short-subunit alcohol dehydrogenase family)